MLESWPVLVVDDDELAREVVVRQLQRLRIRNPIVGLGDGDHTCDVLDALPGPPALMLLDVHMPVRSGLDVLRWMRSRPHLAAARVVMLTGSADIDDIDTAYDLGVTSYLVKPVGFGALDEALRQAQVDWAIVPTGTEPAP